MTVLASCANAGEHIDARTRAVRASLFTTATPLQQGRRIYRASFWTGARIVLMLTGGRKDDVARSPPALSAGVEFCTHHRSPCPAIAILRSQTPTRPARSAAGRSTR